jgi:hypothetical protein
MGQDFRFCATSGHHNGQVGGLALLSANRAFEIAGRAQNLTVERTPRTFASG